MKRGRPAEFRNAAEKQKAYRERKKASEQDIELSWALFNEISDAAVALRNSIEFNVNKGNSVELEYHEVGSGNFCDLRVNGYWRSNCDPFVVRHMIRAGLLVEVSKSRGGIYLQLAQLEQVAS